MINIWIFGSSLDLWLMVKNYDRLWGISLSNYWEKMQRILQRACVHVFIFLMLSKTRQLWFPIKTVYYQDLGFFADLSAPFQILGYYTSTKSWRGYIFTAVCLSVCVCLCVQFFLWTKFQPNGCTNLDAVFAKWLLTALTRTLLNLVTFGRRSRSQWRNTRFFFIILC